VIIVLVYEKNAIFSLTIGGKSYHNIGPPEGSGDSPALQIQFMYPFISRSSFCCSFRSRNPALLSTRSFSLANSLTEDRVNVTRVGARFFRGPFTRNGTKLCRTIPKLCRTIPKSCRTIPNLRRVVRHQKFRFRVNRPLWPVYTK
jgi:hypothetical protein